MTTTAQRTGIVLNTRDFSLTLASNDGITVSRLVHSVAMHLSRQNPLEMANSKPAKMISRVSAQPVRRSL
ncbi:hypothetical protein [Paraburkholderia graminis]|uniref:hypothetical protein n=1 Tax=Paraburkholderia graminis TaxID=60548 RepID=UPI00278FA566|nr:hypothetical protein [Paraburkholderia graminis]MDQ0627154.1 hypothetical protein [Paraburkholderia graminis]